MLEKSRNYAIFILPIEKNSIPKLLNAFNFFSERFISTEHLEYSCWRVDMYIAVINYKVQLANNNISKDTKYTENSRKRTFKFFSTDIISSDQTYWKFNIHITIELVYKFYC